MTNPTKSRLARDIDIEIRRVFGELAISVRHIKRLAAVTVTDKESAAMALALIDGNLTFERATELSELAAKGDFGAIEAQRKKTLIAMIRTEVAGALASNARKLGVTCDELEAEHL